MILLRDMLSPPGTRKVLRRRIILAPWASWLPQPTPARSGKSAACWPGFRATFRTLARPRRAFRSPRRRDAPSRRMPCSRRATTPWRRDCRRSPRTRASSSTRSAAGPASKARAIRARRTRTSSRDLYRNSRRLPAALDGAIRLLAGVCGRSVLSRVRCGAVHVRGDGRGRNRARRRSASFGFGYDPIFFYPPYGTTLGDVPDERKLAVAHRGKAFREFRAWLRTPTSASSPESFGLESADS